jgi:endonuclease/exonuclease/phosphatase family metal-dependent hydrolase
VTAADRSARSLGLLAVGWLLTAGVAAGIVMRWSTMTNRFTIGLVGVVGLLSFGLLALLALVVWRAGSRALRIGAGLVFLGYLMTFGNPRAVIGCGSGASDDQIRIFEQNVYLEHGDAGRIAAALGASDADVAVLVEAKSQFLDALALQPGASTYTYRAVEPTSGSAIWSRLPIDGATSELYGERRFLRATVRSPEGPIDLMAVHTAAPINPAAVANWQAQLGQLGSLDRSGPTVLVGDFNATIDHTQFRRILEAGWTDVHTAKGCGFDLTWPVGRGTGIPLMRLDHVLVTDRFEVLGVDLGLANGSDHVPVIATIRLRPAPAG